MREIQIKYRSVRYKARNQLKIRLIGEYKCKFEIELVKKKCDYRMN